MGNVLGPILKGITKGTAAATKGILQGTGQSYATDPIQQMLDLELQAIDAEAGGSGGGGVSYSAGPAVSSLTSFGNQGDTKLAELYAGLNDYLVKGAETTKGIYDTGIQNITGYYDKGAQEIQAAQNAAQGQIAGTAALSPAGAGTAGDAQKAAQAAIQRQQAIESTAKSNQLSTANQLSSGHQAIAQEIMQGAAQEGIAQRSKLKNQVAGLIAQAQQRAASANASSRASSSNSAGKTEAAKLRALETALGRQTTADEKAGNSPVKGIQGVIQYANKVGHPELAEKFMQYVSAGRINAANANSGSMNNPAIGKNTTSAEAELQKLIGSYGQVDPAISGFANQGNGINNQALASLIQNDPNYSFLKKYIGANKSAFEFKDSKLPDWAKQQVLGKNSNLNNPYVINQFSPQDYQRFQEILNGGSQAQDILGTLYDIYQGKYN